MENREAIEIFNKWMDCKDAYQADPSCDGNCYSCEYYASAEEEKEAMLLAIAALEQQEKAYDEWCTDCKEYDKERHCCPRFSKVIRGAVDEVKQQGWIPCSERLPEEDTEVLISYRYKEGEGDTDHVNIDITSYGTTCFGGREIHTLKEWRQPFDYFHANYEVIAWMPLPTPYREE